jgi:hypothetical protein
MSQAPVPVAHEDPGMTKQKGKEAADASCEQRPDKITSHFAFRVQMTLTRARASNRHGGECDGMGDDAIMRRRQHRKLLKTVHHSALDPTASPSASSRGSYGASACGLARRRPNHDPTDDCNRDGYVNASAIPTPVRGVALDQPVGVGRPAKISGPVGCGHVVDHAGRPRSIVSSAAAWASRSTATSMSFIQTGCWPAAS